MSVLLLRDAQRLQFLCQTSCRSCVPHQGPEPPLRSEKSHCFHGWAVREHQGCLQSQLSCGTQTSRVQSLWDEHGRH